MPRRPTRFQASPIGLDPIVRLWILRVLVPLGRHRQFIDADGVDSEPLAEALHLPRRPSPERDSDFDPRDCLEELRRLHASAEQQRDSLVLPDRLRHNVERLAALVGLNEVERQVLVFVIALHNECLLDETADRLGQLSSFKVFRVLSTILDLPERAVQSALSPQGMLAQSGLVMVERSGSANLRTKLNLLSHTFADLMVSSDADPVTLLRSMVTAGPPGHLQLGDFDHVRASLWIAQPYLSHALAVRRRGVNLLVHGAPGTGKSQLARTLAAELNCELFEVASEDDDGDAITGSARLRAFRAAQHFFAQRKALVVFDEVEDVFADGESLLRSRSTAQRHKAWLNRMLEDNPVPALWLCNSIGGMDAAFIRRFDMVFELPIPPQRQREQILRVQCGDLLDDARLARLATLPTLAPAVAVKAGAVVRAIRAELGDARAAAAVEHLIGGTLEAQGHRPLLADDPHRLPAVYDAALVNVDADLRALADGLARARSGRLCLYGPPGTGKTAYARWLAQHLAVPLSVQRASDLLSKYVGGNERNLARTFAQAQADGALLLIDEVDSFLQDRRGATRSWEVSLVNELLTQMESFTGVFVASTNLMDGLDAAALRRFDLKLKFDFLRPDQAWRLLSGYCRILRLGVPRPTLKPRLQALEQLTPGDFAAAVRQHRFCPLATPAALVAALEAECAVKGTPRRPIGFV